jgi:hypothetical protein
MPVSPDSQSPAPAPAPVPPPPMPLPDLGDGEFRSAPPRRPGGDEDGGDPDRDGEDSELGG